MLVHSSLGTSVFRHPAIATATVCLHTVLFAVFCPTTPERLDDVPTAWSPFPDETYAFVLGKCCNMRAYAYACPELPVPLSNHIKDQCYSDSGHSMYTERLISLVQLTH